jgi:hypothetical protein
VDLTADRYRRFAREAAPRSRTYAAWAQAIADDADCLALIDTLPLPSRQPVLVLTAARVSGLSVHGDICAWLEGEWDSVAQIARGRFTQTNDPRRTMPLLAALQSVPGPIALLEVGASAGLGLLGDHYSHVFADAAGQNHRIDPASGPSALELTCVLGSTVPVPVAMPSIVWRAGLDRHPVQLEHADDERWLRALIWPEEHERALQLDAAIAIAREHPPHLVTGDAVDGLAALAAQAPREATLVIWSPAVLVYLAPAERARFVNTVGTLRGHWISLDGRRVLPAVGARADEALPGPDDDFVLSFDGHPLALVSPHGDRIDRWVAY